MADDGSDGSVGGLGGTQSASDPFGGSFGASDPFGGTFGGITQTRDPAFGPANMSLARQVQTPGLSPQSPGWGNASLGGNAGGTSGGQDGNTQPGGMPAPPAPPAPGMPQNIAPQINGVNPTVVGPSTPTTPSVKSPELGAPVAPVAPVSSAPAIGQSASTLDGVGTQNGPPGTAGPFGTIKTSETPSLSPVNVPGALTQFGPGGGPTPNMGWTSTSPSSPNFGLAPAAQPQPSNVTFGGPTATPNSFDTSLGVGVQSSSPGNENTYTTNGPQPVVGLGTNQFSIDNSQQVPSEAPAPLGTGFDPYTSGPQSITPKVDTNPTVDPNAIDPTTQPTAPMINPFTHQPWSKGPQAMDLSGLDPNMKALAPEFGPDMPVTPIDAPLPPPSPYRPSVLGPTDPNALGINGQPIAAPQDVAGQFFSNDVPTPPPNPNPTIAPGPQTPASVVDAMDTTYGPKYTDPSVSPDPRFTGDWTAYKTATTAIEANPGQYPDPYAAYNQTTKAYGWSQITPDTWSGIVRNNPDLGLPAHAWDATHDQYDAAAAALAVENQQALANKGVDPNPVNTYISNLLGAPVAKYALSQPADTPITSVVPADDIKNNKPLFQGVNTIGDLQARIAARMGAAAPGPSSAPAAPASPAAPGPQTSLSPDASPAAVEAAVAALAASPVAASAVASWDQGFDTGQAGNPPGSLGSSIPGSPLILPGSQILPDGSLAGSGGNVIQSNVFDGGGTSPTLAPSSAGGGSSGLPGTTAPPLSPSGGTTGAVGGTSQGVSEPLGTTDTATGVTNLSGDDPFSAVFPAKPGSRDAAQTVAAKPASAGDPFSAVFREVNEPSIAARQGGLDRRTPDAPPLNEAAARAQASGVTSNAEDDLPHGAGDMTDKESKFHRVMSRVPGAIVEAVKQPFDMANRAYYQNEDPTRNPDEAISTGVNIALGHGRLDVGNAPLSLADALDHFFKKADVDKPLPKTQGTEPPLSKSEKAAIGVAPEPGIKSEAPKSATKSAEAPKEGARKEDTWEELGDGYHGAVAPNGSRIIRTPDGHYVAHTANGRTAFLNKEGKLERGMPEWGRKAVDDIVALAERKKGSARIPPGDVVEGKAGAAPSPASEGSATPRAGDGVPPETKATKSATKLTTKSEREVPLRAGAGADVAGQTKEPPAHADAEELAAKLKQTREERLKEAANEAGGKGPLKTAANAIRGIFSPESMPRGQAADAALRRGLGSHERPMQQALHSFERFRRSINQMDLQDQIEVVGWMERRGEEWKRGFDAPEEIRPLLDTLRKPLQDMRDRLEELPQTEQMRFRDDYFPHVLNDYKVAKKFLAGWDAKTGGASFTKERKMPTVEDLIRAGHDPTTDPIEAVVRYLDNAHRFMAVREAFNEGIDRGDVVWRKAGQQPEGHVALKGSFATRPDGWQAYAPEGWGGTWNAFVSRVPDTKAGALLNTAAEIGSRATQLKLSLSGFHATKTAVEGMANKLAVGLENVAGGNVKGGLRDIAAMPVQSVNGLLTAKKVVKAYLEGSHDPLMNEIVELGEKANFRFVGKGRAADEYRFSKMGDYYTAWRRGALKQQMKASFTDARGRPAAAFSKGVATSVARAFETIQAPLFDYYVPMMKTAAFHDMMRGFLERHPTAGYEEKLAAARRYTKRIDNRFGEMNQDHIYWNAMLKKTAQAGLLSFSYNTGSLRTLYGAGKDTTLAIPRLARNAAKEGDFRLKRPGGDVFTDDMAYAIALPMTLMGVAGMLYWIHTGKPPKDGKDLKNALLGRFETGGKDARTGKPELGVVPSDMTGYQGMVENPKQEAWNKINPFYKSALEMIGSLGSFSAPQDYKGTPLWKSTDPITDKVRLFLEHTIQDVAPMIFANPPMKGSAIGPLERFGGIRPAGQRYVDPAKTKMYEKLHQRQDDRKVVKDRLRQKQLYGP